MRRQPQSRWVDQTIVAVASRQHQVVSHRQLVAAGIHPRTIALRIELGRLHPIFRGVYAVGRADLGPEGRWVAGVLAGGEGAALSHRSAGALWEIVRWRGRVEVTTSRSLRPRPGLLLHRSSLPLDELTSVGPIRVTTVSRTLLDLAAILDPDSLESAVNRAEMLRLGGSPGVRALIDRYPGRRGIDGLRTILNALDAGMAVTRSELEERFRRFLRRADLPAPQLNAPVVIDGRTYVIDCLWRVERLAVELDGLAFHGTRRAFQRDRARDRALLAAGLRTARVTWSDLDRERALERELQAMLAAGTAAGRTAAG